MILDTVTRKRSIARLTVLENPPGWGGVPRRRSPPGPLGVRACRRCPPAVGRRGGIPMAAGGSHQPGSRDCCRARPGRGGHLQPPRRSPRPAGRRSRAGKLELHGLAPGRDDHALSGRTGSTSPCASSTQRARPTTTSSSPTSGPTRPVRLKSGSMWSSSSTDSRWSSARQRRPPGAQ